MQDSTLEVMFGVVLRLTRGKCLHRHNSVSAEDVAQKAMAGIFNKPEGSFPSEEKLRNYLSRTVNRLVWRETKVYKRQRKLDTAYHAACVRKPSGNDPCFLQLEMADEIDHCLKRLRNPKHRAFLQWALKNGGDLNAAKYASEKGIAYSSARRIREEAERAFVLLFPKDSLP